MQIECTLSLFEFEAVRRRVVVAQFDDGTVTSNAGAPCCWTSRFKKTILSSKLTHVHCGMLNQEVAAHSPSYFGFALIPPRADLKLRRVPFGGQLRWARSGNQQS
jgi:hypothetical protein